MVTLVIKYGNGQVYFVQVFNSLAEANAWLAVEQTRGYWKPEFTVETIDKTKEFEDQTAANDLKYKKKFEDLKIAKEKLNEIDLKKINSVPEIIAVLELIHIILKD